MHCLKAFLCCLPPADWSSLVGRMPCRQGHGRDRWLSLALAVLFFQAVPDTAAGEGTSICIRPSEQQHIEETLICKEPVTPFAPPRAVPDDSVAGEGLQQTGDSLSQDLLQSLSCSCAWRMSACSGGADAQECCLAQGGRVCTKAAFKVLIKERSRSCWQVQHLFFILCK